jgi:hypothetical protein
MHRSACKQPCADLSSTSRAICTLPAGQTCAFLRVRRVMFALGGYQRGRRGGREAQRGFETRSAAASPWIGMGRSSCATLEQGRVLRDSLRGCRARNDAGPRTNLGKERDKRPENEAPEGMAVRGELKLREARA